MVQHLVLLLVVPLCILLSLPDSKRPKWFQSPRFDRVGRLLAIADWLDLRGGGDVVLARPTTVQYGGPTASDRIVRDLSLVVAGFAFWWPIYAPCERYRLDPLRGIAYLFSACLGCTLLGIYITFAPLSVCPVFASPVDRIGILNALYDAGLTPGIDQQLGGLMMWVPPCLLYIGAIISLLCRWYSVTEPESHFLPRLRRT